jgi:hypothetical protein
MAVFVAVLPPRDHGALINVVATAACLLNQQQTEREQPGASFAERRNIQRRYGEEATSTAFELADGAPVPAAFVALTVHVYVTPPVRPGTMIGLPFPLAMTAEPPPSGVQVTV